MKNNYLCNSLDNGEKKESDISKDNINQIINEENFSEELNDIIDDKDDCLPKLINIISGFNLEENKEQSDEYHRLPLKKRIELRKALLENKKPIKRKIMYPKEDEVPKKKSVSKRKKKGWN